MVQELSIIQAYYISSKPSLLGLFVCCLFFHLPDNSFEMFKYIDLGVEWSLCKAIKIITLSKFENKYESLLHFEELL